MEAKILILGDYTEKHHTHLALNKSFDHAAKFLGYDIPFEWVDTDKFNTEMLRNYSGMLVAPGSPYKNMSNVLSSLEFTRLNNIPTLGNCGGFQHMIVEFARNVCGIKSADHQETNPDAGDLIITKLACSLINGREELSIVDKDSIIYRIYGKDKFDGSYFCSFGINEKYTELLIQNGCSFPVISTDGNKRVFELRTHLFFLGTLFQPALNSSYEEPAPIIMEFIKQCMDFD